MDTVVAALDVVVLALVARAVRGRRPWLLVAAGAALGLTFLVKPFEGLVAAPALALLAWLGLPGRRAWLLGAGAALAATALAWFAALPVAGGHLPWAYGSSNGSAWDAAFVYDGIARLGQHARAGATAAALARLPAPPGPLRLVSPRDGLALHVGVELAVALAMAALVRPRGRLARAGWWALLTWFGTGVILASAQGGLRPRYLEGVDPAIAAVAGAGAVLSGRRLVLGAAGGALLASLAVSVSAVAHRVEDAGAPGALPPARAAALGAWLGARGGAVASAAVARGAQLVADGDDVVFLAAGAHPLVDVRAIAADVADRRVRSALLGGACGATGRGCTAAERWIRAHGTDASRAAGQPRRGFVYALSAGTRRGTGTSAASRRTDRLRRARRRRRASRAAPPRSGRARPASRQRSASSAAR
jgi:hypothetical protein